MTPIKDIEIYNDRMQKTYADKCWWVEHIPQDVNFIIDLGCADAGIFEYIDAKYPNRFFYLGIDENEEMLKRAKARLKGKDNTVFCTSLDAFYKLGDERKIILLLNSVLHEVFSYKSKSEIEKLVKDITNLKASYIAIRDMHEIDSIKPLLNVTIDHYNEQFWEHAQNTSFPINNNNFLVEFLLKYFYKENWQREVKEQYLWNWSDWLKDTFESKGLFAREYEEDFSIKFLQDKWMQDFGAKIDVPTHKKVLLKGVRK